MGKPAARVGDMHVCPMQTPATPPIPHVGGPILPPGVPTVLIGGMPAAVMGGMATCVGPPDSIVLGSSGVMIGGQPAARMGDSCAHGGTIVVGCPTVLIGETSPGSPPMVMIVAKPSPASESSAKPKSPQAATMNRAAERGTPFCEVCEEEAKKEAEGESEGSTAEEETQSWIAFSVEDKDGNPIVAQKYKLELPDGRVIKGVTDAKGKVRVEGVKPGSAKITFPDAYA